MKAKSVAERAAELGTDQQELVRALNLLSRRKIASRRSNRRDRWGRRQSETCPVMSEEQAAKFLGVDPKDAVKEMDKVKWKLWSTNEMLTATFAFHKKHGRWPKSHEYKLANDLPPRDQWRWRAWNEADNWNIRARDAWERRLARDRRCTPEMALTLRNVLARKEAIDRIGFQTFIKRGMATVIDDDPEFGVLYRLPGETPKEPMVLLKVINSTPEPDGSFADYYLRVPPTETTARSAVRWTFGGDEMLGSQEYKPLVQT